MEPIILQRPLKFAQIWWGQFFSCERFSVKPQICFRCLPGKGGKSQLPNCTNRAWQHTSAVPHRLSDGPKQGLTSLKLWHLAIPARSGNTNALERKVLQSIHTSKTTTYPSAYSRAPTSLKRSVAGNMLFELEESALNTFTNVCLSIILWNKISGKTAAAQDLDGQGLDALPVKSKNFSLIVLTVRSGFFSERCLWDSTVK